MLRTEMSSLLESVAVSGQHVLLAAQKLGIQPSLAEHREELITAAQNVFLGVVKVKYDSKRIVYYAEINRKKRRRRWLETEMYSLSYCDGFIPHSCVRFYPP